MVRISLSCEKAPPANLGLRDSDAHACKFGTCAFQLSYGKLYNLFPTKWVFLIALGIFELGSLVCGATPSSVGLIMGRVVAGIGSGGIFSGVQSSSLPRASNSSLLRTDITLYVVHPHRCKRGTSGQATNL